MARVQSILTYTVAAGTSTCPPKAPLRCGCDDLLLILEDRSLLQTALRGILPVVIKNVAVSNAPVPYIDSYGNNSLVWKYDYTIEYKDTDLTDPAYRIRKCDIAYNCCYSCSQVYTDRQLESYVKSVTGDIVDNSDPQNPVLTVPPVIFPEVISDSLVNTASRGLRHTSVDGTVVDFINGISAVNSNNTCLLGGVGAGFSIKNAVVQGDGTLLLNGAPEHYSPASSGGGTAAGPDLGVVVPLDTDWFSASRQLVLGNPSNCRTASVAIFLEGIIEFETPGIPFKYNWALQLQFDGLGYNDVQARNSYSAGAGTLDARDEKGTFRTVVLTLAAGQSITVDLRLRWRPVGSNGIVQSYNVGISAIGGTN